MILKKPQRTQKMESDTGGIAIKNPEQPGLFWIITFFKFFTQLNISFTLSKKDFSFLSGQGVQFSEFFKPSIA